jgi:hypothetical protein
MTNRCKTFINSCSITCGCCTFHILSFLKNWVHYCFTHSTTRVPHYTYFCCQPREKRQSPSQIRRDTRDMLQEISHKSVPVSCKLVPEDKQKCNTLQTGLNCLNILNSHLLTVLTLLFNYVMLVVQVPQRTIFILIPVPKVRV